MNFLDHAYGTNITITVVYRSASAPRPRSNSFPAGHLLFRDAAVYAERRKKKLARKADAELDGEELRFEPEAKGRAWVSFVGLMGGGRANVGSKVRTKSPYQSQTESPKVFVEGLLVKSDLYDQKCVINYRPPKALFILWCYWCALAHGLPKHELCPAPA